MRLFDADDRQTITVANINCEHTYTSTRKKCVIILMVFVLCDFCVHQISSIKNDRHYINILV